MTKFRKKPVVIEAFQFTVPVISVMPDWMLAAAQSGTIHFHHTYQPTMTIKTLEGDMTASVGDWIIRGVTGEIYPCKPDIFAMTYEAVEE